MKRKNDELQDMAVAEVRQVYADLAARPIERNCVAFEGMLPLQAHRTHSVPDEGRSALAAKALRATGRKHLPDAAGGACPLLETKSGNCLIYSDRPFGCRTHFCAAAGGPYARREVADLIHRLERIDADLGGDGASALPHAVAEALNQLR